jgi:uncharacterized membrane protein YkoI
MKAARFLGPSFVLATTFAAFAGETKPVALSATPPAVQKTIAAQITAGKLGEIDQTIEDGETIFDVTFTTKTGVERDLSISGDGTALSIEVQMADTPAAVQNTIKAQASGWTLEGIDQSLDDPDVSFDIETAKDGRERNFTVAADGDLLSIEIELGEAPPAVQATIKSVVGDGSLKSIDEDMDPADNTFDVDAVAKNGEAKSFTVRADGALESVQVSLEQVPAAARKTIQDSIGSGTILRIDKSVLEKTNKVLPYVVEGRKDGMPFDFSVGPKGKFLGMSE